MPCAKLLGQRPMARDFYARVAGPQIRAAVLNRYTTLASLSQSPEPKCVRGKGKPALRPLCATKPR